MPSDADTHRSGKLRFKRSRRKEKEGHRQAQEQEDAREARHRARQRRERTRDLDNEMDDVTSAAAGPSRHPTAIFGDDLLRAEKFEARLQEEKDWSAKLNDLLQDDLPDDRLGDEDAAWEEEMMRIRGDQFDGEIHQTIPKRWQDAAQGFETNMARGAAGLRDLDEEEYAEYIREGMYRRKHSKEIAEREERERRWKEAQDRKRKARDERREAKRKAREMDEKKQSILALTLARETWEKQWSEMASTNTAATTVPWPIYPGPELTKDSILHFLFHDSEMQEASKRLRRALLRYHPDRFLSSTFYLRLKDDEGKEKIRQAVEKVAKTLSEIVDERRA